MYTEKYRKQETNIPLTSPLPRVDLTIKIHGLSIINKFSKNRQYPNYRNATPPFFFISPYTEIQQQMVRQPIIKIRYAGRSYCFANRAVPRILMRDRSEKKREREIFHRGRETEKPLKPRPRVAGVDCHRVFYEALRRPGSCSFVGLLRGVEGRHRRRYGRFYRGRRAWNAVRFSLEIRVTGCATLFSRNRIASRTIDTLHAG